MVLIRELLKAWIARPKPSTIMSEREQKQACVVRNPTVICEHVCRCSLRRGVNVAGDYYFALFLCCKQFLHLGGHHSSFVSLNILAIYADPTMTQQFFAHFNCRRLSEYMLVLHKDYDTECWADNTTWWILAVTSAIGLLGVSLGIPIGMWMWMRSVMQDEVKNIHEKTKSRPRAYRDFRDKFSYIAVRRYRPSRLMLGPHLASCHQLLTASTLDAHRTNLKQMRTTQSVLTCCASWYCLV